MLAGIIFIFFIVFLLFHLLFSGSQSMQDLRGMIINSISLKSITEKFLPQSTGFSAAQAENKGQSNLFLKFSSNAPSDYLSIFREKNPALELAETTPGQDEGFVESSPFKTDAFRKIANKKKRKVEDKTEEAITPCFKARRSFTMQNYLTERSNDYTKLKPAPDSKNNDLGKKNISNNNVNTSNDKDNSKDSSKNDNNSTENNSNENNNNDSNNNENNTAEESKKPILENQEEKTTKSLTMVKL